MGDSFIFDDDESRQSSFTEMPEGESPEGGEEGGSPDGSNNRTFLIAAGILGGVILLALLCMAAYAFFLLPRQRAAQSAQQAAILLTNTAIAGGATSTAQALLATPTLNSADIAATSQAIAATRQMGATQTAAAIAAAASPTPVVVFFTATSVPETASPEPITQTVAALYTQAAVAELTGVPIPVYAKIVAGTGGKTDIYTDPSGTVMASLPNGFIVEVLPETQNINGKTWAHVRFIQPGTGSVDGWVDQSSLSNVPSQSVARIHTNNGSSVIIHATPGGTTLATLDNGILVEVLPETQVINGTRWAHIRFTQPGIGTVDGWVEQQNLLTGTPTPVGAVPTTGFADQVGLPGLFIIAFVLIAIILLARRLRSSPAAR